MTTARRIILAQLAAVHDTKVWFVAMSDAVAGLTAEQAARLDGSDGHSVWQILNHVTFWNERYLSRFRGEPLPDVGDNASTFIPERSAGSDDDWRAACSRYDTVMKEWKAEIEAAEETRLESPMRKDTSETWYSSLANQNIHTAHHVGQIVTIRKQQGTWDPRQGVS